MLKIPINNAGETPEIYTGDSVFEELKRWLFSHSSEIDSIFVLTDKNTRSCCLDKLTNFIPLLQAAEILQIEPGEKSKSLSTAEYLWKELSAKGATRRSLMINLGGGVVTDLGGFVASTYNRGIPFIHIPTSLMGMVDAAIGGKTGINLGNIKNQIGTFHQPEAIFISTTFLSTLPYYELRNGIAEVIKIALISDILLWGKLKLLRVLDFLLVFEDESMWSELINTAVWDKSAIVIRDFKEKEHREILNFGHTIGHAFESLSLSLLGKHPSHGHAIALGMICESFISVIKSGLDIGDRDSIIEIVLTHFKYFPLQDKDVDLMMNFMAYDKKRRNSGLRLSLLKSPGNAVPGIICTPEEILESINFYRSLGEESEES